MTGENIACNYLRKNGYYIIVRNFNCIQGEIDIIAIDDEEYVFVEVKTRISNKYGNPVEAVNAIKQKHIKNASKYFIYKNGLENKFIRFDVIEIYIRESKTTINHIKSVLW